MGISKSLSFCEGRTNFGEIDFLCPALTRLAVFVAATFNDLFDTSVVETLVVADLTILHLSMRYWI